MADIDIDPFGEHGSRLDEPTGENTPSTPVGGSTWEPEHEQETSFRGGSQRTKLMKEYVEGLYQKISERRSETPGEFHFDYFILEDGELYYKGSNKPLTTREGKLRLAGEIEKILGKRGLRNLGFHIPRGISPQQSLILNKAEEAMPSASDVAKADEIELKEITENAIKSTKHLITQFEGEETLPMHKLLGLDKQLKSIRGLLKVEVAKKVQLEENIEKEKCKLKEF